MGLRCDECKKEMKLVHEPSEVRIGARRFIHSEPIDFFRCEKCDEEDISGKEIKKSLKSASRIFLEKVVSGQEELTGENIIWLRSVAQISKSDLSKALDIRPQTVSNWETRDKKFELPMAQGIALNFARLLMANKVITQKEMIKIGGLVWERLAG